MEPHPDPRPPAMGWRRLLPWLLPAFVLLVLTLAIQRAQLIDWPAVGEALTGYRLDTLTLAVLLTVTGHLCAGSYDLIGRRYTGHALSGPRVMAINLAAYVFAHNLGAMVGGWGFRWRLYTRCGLAAGTVTRIIALAVVTNWSGFVVLLGLALLISPPALPDIGLLSAAPLRVVGGLLLAAVLFLLWLSAHATRRGWQVTLRGWTLPVPPPRMLLLQVALSSLSWLCMAATLHVLLPSGVNGIETMTMLFFSSIAGVLLHVPGGLGVMEGSLAVLLGPRLGIAQVVAAVLAFRCIYYFLPLLAAATLYVITEWRAASCRKQVSAPPTGRDAAPPGSTTPPARCGSGTTVNAVSTHLAVPHGRPSSRSCP